MPEDILQSENMQVPAPELHSREYYNPRGYQPATESLEIEPEVVQQQNPATAISFPTETTLEKKLEPQTFNWEKTQADRYVQDKNYKNIGFEPYAAPVQIDGQYIDANELKYEKAMTFGHAMNKAAGGFAAITRNAFTEGWKGDARLFNALFGAPWSDQTFKERLMGTPEDLAEMDAETKRIMNKYAIYHTPESDNTVFNKQFLGDVIQQMGFTVGTAGQMLAEAALTWGIGEAFSAAAKGLGAGAMVERVATGAKAIPRGEMINDLRKANNISQNTPLMKDMVSQFGRWGAKQLNPLTGAQDVMHTIEAGGTGFQVATSTVGGLKRLFSQTNMAATEARFEAAGTFGQMYGDLLTQYQDKHDGQMPIGDKLTRIQKAAYGASTDTFIVNTGLLMTMNQLQFGNMFSKFSSSSKLLRGALEQGEGKLLTVSGKIGEKTATKSYTGLRELGRIRKDFGMGTALGVLAKKSVTGTVAKFEVTEGLQELLQESSNNALREYYTNLYDGNKDLDGASLWNADYGKAFSDQYNIEGWKTFLMGAATGLVMSPLQASVMYSVRKGYGAVNEDYKKESNGKKQALEANRDIQNAFYGNIENVLNEHIANTKVQGQAQKTLEEGITSGSKYTYINGQTDALSKAVASSLKTGTFESLVSTIEEFTEMSDEEIQEAFPAVEKTVSGTREAREYLTSVVEDIRQYKDNWENLNERYGHLIMPELYRSQGNYKRMLVAKKALNEAIETLATTSYQATETIKRASAIQDEVAKFPSIGSNIYTTFDILSDPKQLAITKGLLEEEVAVLEQLGKDKEIQADKKNAKGRLELLEKWETADEEELQSIFEQYVEAEYNLSSTDPMDRSNLDRSFELLAEYMGLKNDNRAYVNALNILNNPRGFKGLYNLIDDALRQAKVAQYTKQDEEAENIIKNDDSLPGDLEEEEEEEFEEQPENVEEYDEVVGYYTNRQKGQKLSTEAKEWLKRYKGLKKKLDNIYKNALEPEALAKDIEEAINKAEELYQDDHTVLYNPPVHNAPKIVPVEGGYKIVPNIQQVDTVLKTKNQANKLLIDYIKKNSKKGGSYEIFMYHGRELQKGQSLYHKNSGGEITHAIVTRVPEEGKVLKVSRNGVNTDTIEISKESLNTWYDTENEAKEGKTPDSIKEVKKPAVRTVDGKVNWNDPLKLNWNDMFGVYTEDYDKLTKTLLGISKEDINSGALTIVVEKKDNSAKKPFNPTAAKNPAVAQLYTDKVYKVMWEGKHIMSITPNAGYYRFNVERNGKMDAVPASQLTEQEFWSFFNPPVWWYTDSNRVSTTELFEKFKREVEKVKAFVLTVGNKEKLSIKEVHKLLQFNYVTRPKWRGKGNNTLREILEVLPKGTRTIDKHGYPKLVVNNSYNAKYKEDKPTLGGTEDTKGLQKELEKARAQGHVGTAGVPLELENGEVIWVQLSPKKMSETEITGILNKVNKLITGPDGKANVKLEGGSEQVNDLLRSIFIALPVYKDGKYIERKWGLDITNVQEKNGDWHTTVFFRETAGDPEDRKSVRLKLDIKKLTPKELVASINRAVGERGKNGELKHPELQAIQVREDMFRHQFNPNDIESILDMDTDVSVEDGVFVDMSLIWDFKGDTAIAAKSAQPAIPKVNDTVVNAIMAATSIQQLTQEHRDYIQKLVDEGKLAKNRKTDLASIKKIIGPVETKVPVATKQRTIEDLVKEGYEFIEDQGMWLTPAGRLVPEQSLIGATAQLANETSNVEEEGQKEDLDNFLFENQQKKKEIAKEAENIGKKKVASSADFNSYSVENIDKFKEWVQKNLPDFVTIEELDSLITNLKNNNVTIGQFLFKLEGIKNKVAGGILQIGKEGKAAYHEAFHAVFNLLLTDDKIQKLLDSARKEYPITDKKVEDYLRKNPERTGTNRKELEELVLEEYMADKFDSWMADRKTITSHTITGFFARLWDMIKKLWERLTSNQMAGLFREIDRGQYRNSGLMDNRFTTGNVTLPKAASVEIGWDRLPDGTLVKRVLPQQTVDQLSAAIAGMFVQRLNNDPVYQQSGKYNKNAILNDILDMYKDLLDVGEYDEELRTYTGPRYDHYKKVALRNIKDKATVRQFILSVVDRYTVFSTPAGRNSLKEAVDQYLRVMGLRQELDDEAREIDELENGPLNTEKLERESAFTIGGHDTLPSEIRKLIGSVVYPITETPGKHDEFYDTTFLDGTPIVQAVNASKVYNGMTKLMANTSDVATLLDKMIEYVNDGSNPETIRFINYVFDMTGFDPVVYKQSGISATKNEGVLQQVIKAFNKYGVKTLFVSATLDSGPIYTVMESNAKDAAFYQMNEWQRAFNDTFYDRYTNKDTKVFVAEAAKPLKTLRKKLNGAIAGVDSDELLTISKEISDSIQEKLGINLHPTYIKFSILKSKDDRVLEDDQRLFLNNNSTIEPIYIGPLTKVIEQLESSDKNLFSRDKEGVKTSAQTLDRWAKSNALFDENIAMMSHTTADGKTMANYVDPYYIGMQVGDINKSNWTEGISYTDEVLDNPLLGDKKFNTLRERNLLQVEFIGGIRQQGSKTVSEEVFDEEEGVYSNIGDEVTEIYGIGKEGAVYSDFTSREFITTLLAMYNVTGQSGTKEFTGDKFFYKVRVPIRVPGEKSMFALVSMPIIHSALDGKLTKEALDILYNRIENEYKRINEVQKQIDNGTNIGTNSILDWNTGTLNGLKLFTTAKMVGGLKSGIEKDAREGKELDRAAIEEQLNNYFSNQVLQFAKKMEQTGLITDITEEGEELTYDDRLAPTYLFDGFNTPEENDKTYMGDNFMHNLMQVYMNAFLNTTLLNNLLHGDESKLYKKDSEVTKRETGSMAVHKSIEGATMARNMGIAKAIKKVHHVTYNDEKVKASLGGDDKNLDDGQMYHTEKGLRYILFGKGSLNATQVQILKDLAQGKAVNAEQVFGEGGLKDRGAFNSLKLVYNDGQTYLKCSSLTLFAELTSYPTIENGKKVWKPLPEREELHNLRERLEAYEEQNETVAFAHPVSVSKMLTKNIYEGTSFKDIDDSQFEELDAKYMGEQLANPSGKLMINDPTQAKGQIMNEQDDSIPVKYLGSWTDANGKSWTVGRLKNVYLQETAKRMNNNWVTARDGIFNIDEVNADIKSFVATKKVSTNLARFLEHAKKNLEATGSDAQLLEFMQVENGKPVYNINFPSLLPKITQIFFSYFSGGVLREKVPGLSLAIVSPARGLGMRVKEVTALWTQEDIDKYKPIVPGGSAQSLLGQPRIWRVVPDSEWVKKQYKYEKWYDRTNRLFAGLELKDGKVYVADEIRDNYLHFEDGEPVGYFSEALRPAHYKEEMNGIQLKDGFGTRIPSVDKNSYTAIKFVDTLPAYMGSIIVVPREYYERTGADNDIDKDYVSIQDTYVKEGKRVPYGTAKNIVDQLQEYVTWNMKNNRMLKERVNVLLDKDEGVKESRLWLAELKAERESIIDDIDTYKNVLRGYTSELLEKKAVNKGNIKETLDYIDMKRDFYIRQSLDELQMPSTIEEFYRRGGENLNTGVLNNRILAAKIGMLNNAAVVELMNTITSTQSVKDIITNLYEELKDGKSDYAKQVRDKLVEINVDINSLLGMVNDRESIMTGAKSIGSVATTNIVYSFLNRHKLDLINNALTINGHIYKSFSNLRAWDGKSYSGNRIFSSLTALTNVMTDNTKDRDAGKLNLDQSATGYASYLIAEGVPEEVAYLYAWQPAVAEYLKQRTGYTIEHAEEEGIFKSVYLKKKIEELEAEGAKGIKKGVTPKMLIDNIKNGGSNKNIELQVLLDIQKLDKQQESMFRLARLIRLNQGFKPDMEQFDQLLEDMEHFGIRIKDGRLVKVSDKEYNATDPTIDIRDILLTDDAVMSGIMGAVNQMNSMLPAMFTERTAQHILTTKAVMATLQNAPKDKVKGRKFKRTLKYDITGYYNLLAYKKWLTDNKQNDGSTLHNSLIYSPDDNITHMVEGVQQQLTAQNLKNYLLSYFLVPVQASELTQWLYLVESNTWTKLSQLQQARLISSFVDLYTNTYEGYGIETYELAKALFNYLLVKDGGQFSNGSFIRLLPPFIFRDIMNRLGDVTKVLATQDKAMGVEVFGNTSSNKLMNDFVQGYTVNIGNKKNLINLRIEKNILAERSEEDLKEIKKLTKEEQRAIEQHSGNGIYVIGNRNKDGEAWVEVDLFGGIRKKGETGPYTKAENIMLRDNIKHLEKAGITKVEKKEGEPDKGVRFPMTYNYKGRLFNLVEIEGKDKDGKKYTRKSDFIEPGEYAPHGTRAIYKPAKWKGSARQWKGAHAVGEVPDYVENKFEVSAKNKVETQEVIENSEYRQVDDEVILRNGSTKLMYKYQNDAGEILMNEYGKPVRTPREAAKVLAMKSQPDVVSSTSMQQDLFSQQSTGIQRPLPGVEVYNTPLSIAVANSFIDLLQPQIKGQAYKENKGKKANKMFSFGLNWGRKTDDRFPARHSENNKYALKNTSFNGDKETYRYFTRDQNGNPITDIKALQPIMDYIQSVLGIDMSAYDTMLGNIYEPATFISQHKDTTESRSAEKYPVIVLNLGASSPIILQEDTRQETKISLINGGIYAFGIEGQNRLISHRTIDEIGQNPLKPIIVEGETVKDYRITLTFRRAQDITADMPKVPKKLQSQQPVVPSQQMMQYTPENVTSLQPNQVFVFGSNAEGVHGKGAALLAKQKFGAKQGQAEGLQGQSYAVITKKNWRVEKSSTLQEIGKGLQDMLLFAKNHPEKQFLVTKLGSSLAGYTVEEIKGLFQKLEKVIPDNVVLPKEYEVRDNQQTTGTQQMTSEQWKAELSTIFGDSRKPIAEAIKYRDLKRTENIADSDILNKI